MTIPNQYPRRILLAVTGGSPQVVTETLYKLAVDTDRPFIPTEIHVISTSKGVRDARLMLLDPDQGHFYRLVREYGLPAANIRFDESCLHTIRDEAGHQLGDIIDEDSNRAAANFIVEQVRELCADDNSLVHASLAGGRKTMGFFLGYAMSLLGRRRDRLSHVLVNPPFESCPDFFYPPRRPQRLVIRGEPVRTDEAQIMLADIPFVRMQHAAVLANLHEGASYSETVGLIQASLDEPELHVDLDSRAVRAHGTWFTLGPVQMALLVWLAIRARVGVPEVVPQDHEASNLRQLRRVMEETEVPPRSLWFAGEELEVERFRENLTRLKQTLERHLKNLAEIYRIHSTGRRPRTSYRLRLDPEHIEITGTGAAGLIEEIRAEVLQARGNIAAGTRAVTS